MSLLLSFPRPSPADLEVTTGDARNDGTEDTDPNDLGLCGVKAKTVFNCSGENSVRY